MNPLTNMKNVIKLSEQELYTNNRTSWHDQYRDSAWVFIGGLPYDLSEGDIICIFSQYGEVVNINLIRDKDNGKSKGFCFLCYEDQRSTVLAVDNFNGIRVLNRILRVDHVSNYKVPKQGEKTDDVTKKLYSEGCAPKPVVPTIIKQVVKLESQCLRETLADQIQADIKLPERLPIYPIKKEPEDGVEKANIKQEVEEKPEKDSNEPMRGSENERQHQKNYPEKRKQSDLRTEANKHEMKTKEKYGRTNEDSGSSRGLKNKFPDKQRNEETYKSRTSHDLKKTRPSSPNNREKDRSDRKKNYSHETRRPRRRSRSRSREYRR